MIKDKQLQDSFERVQFKFAELIADERHKGNVYPEEGEPSVEEDDVIKKRSLDDVRRAYYEHRAQQLEEIQSKFLSLCKKIEKFGDECEQKRQWVRDQEIMEYDSDTGLYTATKKES